MAGTLYASFADASLAEKAAGALLDFGVRNEDISLVSRERTEYSDDTARRDVTAHSAAVAERGYTGSTTYADRDADGNDAVNAGQSAWQGAESVGNKIGEGMDRAGARAAGMFGATGTEANLDRAADEHRMEAREDAADAGREFRQATDMDESGGARVYDRTDTDRDSNTTVIDHTTGAGDDTELAAKQGLSTTTAGDAAAGAAKGAGIGLGVGVLAALASLVIPGFGLVVGGGALATAIAGAAGATAAGAVAGGVHGYLKDQGVPDHVAVDYDNAYKHGGAILAVTLPSGNVDEAQAREILAKYSASNVNTYGSQMAA